MPMAQDLTFLGRQPVLSLNFGHHEVFWKRLKMMWILMKDVPPVMEQTRKILENEGLSV